MSLMDVVANFYEKIDLNAFQNCIKRHPNASNCIECCREEYFNDDIEIDYSCANKRLIYVVRYLPVHHSEIYDAITLIPNNIKYQLLDKESIKVLSIGGGPGTDVSAFNRWIKENQSNLRRLKYIRIDKQTGWDDTSQNIIRLCQPDGVRIECENEHFDVTSVSFNSSQLGEFDVVILSYIISEIPSDKINQLAINIKSKLNRQSVIIINDRNENNVRDKMNKLCILLDIFIPIIKEPKENDYCGFTYPDEIWERLAPKPKIYKKSFRCMLYGC
jgi:hypothetical protein